MNRFYGFLRLIRPVNCLMMGFAVIVGAAIADPSGFSETSLGLFYGFVTGFMLTAASMAVNDYYDRRIDSINEPNRPIPSGLVTPKEALVLASILGITGLVAAFLTNLLCLIIGMSAWFIFVVYTTVGKSSGVPGNLLVSACVAIPFIYGSAAIINTVQLNIIVFAFMAFLANTGREITKGIMDVEGDRTGNVKTLAAQYGEEKAAIAATSFYFCAVLMSFLPVFLGLVSWLFIPVVAIADFGFVISSLWLLINPARQRARKVKNFALMWSMIGLFAFIVGIPAL
ncbi:MAG: geranylgeranylglycerol-phosphate geranylgeranyltransferase [Candidatus Bathyarchaeota archaeon]